MATSHFSLPEFTATGTADLIGIYNAAIEAIDTALYNIQSTANTANSTATTANNTANSAVSVNATQATDISSIKASLSNITGFAPSSSDAALTVSNLNGAKITSAGIVYFKKASA